MKSLKASDIVRAAVAWHRGSEAELSPPVRKRLGAIAGIVDLYRLEKWPKASPVRKFVHMACGVYGFSYRLAASKVSALLKTETW